MKSIECLPAEPLEAAMRSLKYSIAEDDEGFFIVDEEGFDITPTTRSQSWEDAVRRLCEIIRQDAEAEDQAR
jgi:hypothetical protein